MFDGIIGWNIKPRPQSMSHGHFYCSLGSSSPKGVLATCKTVFLCALTFPPACAQCYCRFDRFTGRQEKGEDDS